MSDVLKQFYRDIWKWITEGCHAHVAFDTSFGLCTNLSRYCDNVLHMGYHQWLPKILEQEKLFIEAGLDDSFPFNEGDEDYDEECGKDSIFSNPNRLKWIQEHAR